MVATLSTYLGSPSLMGLSQTRQSAFISRFKLRSTTWATFAPRFETIFLHEMHLEVGSLQPQTRINGLPTAVPSRLCFTG